MTHGGVVVKDRPLGDTALGGVIESCLYAERYEADFQSLIRSEKERRSHREPRRA